MCKTSFCLFSVAFACLGERRSSLLIVHRLNKLCLFLFGQKRQLIGRVKRDFLFIDHIRQRWDKLSQTDISLYLTLTFSGLFCHGLNRSLQLLANFELLTNPLPKRFTYRKI